MGLRRDLFRILKNKHEKALRLVFITPTATELKKKISSSTRSHDRKNLVEFFDGFVINYTSSHEIVHSISIFKNMENYNFAKCIKMFKN